MSSTDAAHDIDTSLAESAKTAETTNNTENDNKTNSDTTNQNKPIKKVKSKKDLKNDPSRFDPPGVNFNAKLIGIDDVAEARGDKMCQESMYRLKVAVKQSGQHKQKIIINVSLDGIRIIDIRTQATNHTHAVHRISFISRDVTDNRAFGYVYGAGEGKHKFYAIKTEKASEALVLTLRDLFQCVYELKKREVEDAKHKVDEPAAETATEAKDDAEPVYSKTPSPVQEEVPLNKKPVENGSEPTYEVPPNNKPVVEEAPDLLNLENELESMERRIEQIDTMEELFKELEAPPPASTPASNPASGTTSWASDLAGLSSAPPTFSVGGAAFTSGGSFGGATNTSTAFPGGQPFGQPNQPFGQPNQPFGQPGQPFGQPSQPFGQPNQPFGQSNQPFGQPNQPFGQPQPGFGGAPGQPAGGFGAGGFPAQPGAQPGFGASANPFGAPPGVPPRTGMGMPGQPATAGGFPGGQPQPGFPMGAPQNAMLPVSNDPFGNDPFAADGGGLLEPARQTPQIEEPNKPQPSDAFGDLVSIGSGGKTNKSPKDLFKDLSAPDKKSLKELQTPKQPGNKSPSPTGFQASDESPGFDDVTTAAATDPFGSGMGFSTSDPFANDPFASTAPAQQNVQPPNAQQLFSDDGLFGDNDNDTDPYNIPLPQGPPPPLPEELVGAASVDPPWGPPPPPRPSVNNPQCTSTPTLPRIPPRPSTNTSSTASKLNTSAVNSSNLRNDLNVSNSSNVSSISTHSSVDSVNSSPVSVRSAPEPAALTSSGSDIGQQSTPPLPPRPRGATQTVPIPRPRPRASVPQTSQSFSNHTQQGKSKHASVISNNSDSCVQHDSVSSFSSQSEQRQSVSSTSSQQSAKRERLQSTESQRSDASNSSKPEHRSSSVVADPFVSTDPFAAEDPFSQQADPFASDPFAPDPFTNLDADQYSKTDNGNDPFTSVISSPRVTSEDSDPFTVFDNKFLNESFKFEKSSSRKGKLKVTGQ